MQTVKMIDTNRHVRHFARYSSSLAPKLSESHTYENVQNERAAIIEDDVRRGLGMLPQRAIFKKASKGDFAKMSKPVQVCTACQFVKGQNIALIHFCYVKITLSHLWTIRPQAEILFSHF